jgi:hypothetical protein
MIEVSKTVAQFIGDFKSLDYCCHRIIELNEELEELNHKMLGLSHSVEELSKEQMKSSLPMPTYQRTFTSKLALLETIEEKEREIQYYQKRINECKAFELLGNTDMNILYDLYFFRMSQYDVAGKYGFSRSGLKKHVHAMIKNIL